MMPKPGATKTSERAFCFTTQYPPAASIDEQRVKRKTPLLDCDVVWPAVSRQAARGDYEG
jgi:hypothetical protein